MPTPEYDDGPDEDRTPEERILGDERATATYIEDLEGSTRLNKITRHAIMLTALFRRLHARSNKRPVYEKADDGKRVQVGTEPEVLNDKDLWEKYPLIKQWWDAHAQATGHNVSIQGFSINSVSGRQREPERRERASKDNSAGADDADDVAW